MLRRRAGDRWCSWAVRPGSVRRLWCGRCDLGWRVGRLGVVVLVTYRDDGLAAIPSMIGLVGDLASSAMVRRISLARLSDRAVGVLAEQVGLDPGELSRVTAGNPFLVVEALAAGG